MPKKQPDQPWEVQLVRDTGAAMRRARGTKSARELSDETAELGRRISPTVIAKLDSGHRGAVLNVTELLVLAAALDIPPILLLFDGYPNGEVEYLPGRVATSQAAVEWFSGEAAIPGAEGLPNTGVSLVAAVRQLRESLNRLTDVVAQVEDDAIPQDAWASLRESLNAQIVTAAGQITELRRNLEGETR